MVNMHKWSMILKQNKRNYVDSALEEDEGILTCNLNHIIHIVVNKKQRSLCNHFKFMTTYGQKAHYSDRY